MQSQETNSHTANSVAKKKNKFAKAGTWFDVQEILTPEDMIRCEALFRRAHDELVPHLSFDMDAIVRHAQIKLADPERLNYNAWVAYCEGQPIGFIIGSISGFYFSYDRLCQLDVWYVDKRFRGSACAFLLLKRLIQWGALRGAVRTILAIVIDKHKPKYVAAFSKMAAKLGFREAGSFYVRDYNATRVDDQRN